jgi:hypothetical protein
VNLPHHVWLTGQNVGGVVEDGVAEEDYVGHVA